MSGGDPVHARDLLEEALTGFARTGTDPLGAAMTRTTLVFCALREGDTDRAERLCADSRRDCRDHGDVWWQAFTLQASAVVAFAAGATDDGRRYAQEALRLHHVLGDSVGMLTALDGIARAAAGIDPQRAARLLGASFQMWRSIGGDTSKPDLYWHGREDLLTAIRSDLGKAAFDTAFERGRRMTRDDAIGYALGSDPAGPPLPDRDVPVPDPLTPREHQVAELIGQGLTNRQIAARLVISRRTAESDVENILRKLGLTSRVQATARLNDERCGPD